MQQSRSPQRRKPGWWVPTLYFAEGVPMITVSVVAAIMYKNMGAENDVIALYTGLLYLPWTIKPLWAPLLEMWSTKRRWVLATEVLMAAALAAVALSLPLPSYMAISLAFFWIIGFLSSTQDIAADGLYLSVMPPREQSRWVGVQGIFWDAGRILASGVLVSLTGYLHDRSGSWTSAWMVVMFIIAAIMLLLAGWHSRVLPTDRRAIDAPRTFKQAAATFYDSLRTFFLKKGIWAMFAYILLYRSGVGFLEKIGPMFMMDSREVGGLGLDNQALGHINGTFGAIGFMVGSLLGGLYAARVGLRRSLLVLCLGMNIPSATYIYLALALPTNLVEITAWATVEKIGYGFGSVAVMLYMMQQLAPGPYRMAHYAFGTALMALGVMIPSMISGYVQMAVGHGPFFVIVMVASLPSVLATLFAPFHVKEEEAPALEPAAPAPTTSTPA